MEREPREDRERTTVVTTGGGGGAGWFVVGGLVVALIVVAVLFGGDLLDRSTTASIDMPDEVKIEVPDVNVNPPAEEAPAEDAPAPANDQ